VFLLAENYKINHASSQGERRNARKTESTKETITMGKLRFKQINPVAGPKKNRHQFKDLSKKIIGAAIEVHFSHFRTFALS